VADQVFHSVIEVKRTPFYRRGYKARVLMKTKRAVEEFFCLVFRSLKV
jgi:hypothetical protein